MLRFAITSLTQWAQETKPKPLILRGARQVGKSTLVRKLCESLKMDLVEINLEIKKIKELENTDNFQIERVVDEIQVLTGARLTENSLLFLDEVQEQPIALNRLRYFYEDLPGLRVIAAGSLLEVVMEKESFSMPVGRVEYFHLGPMTFYEFLHAKGEHVALEQLQQLSTERPPTHALHLKAADLLKEYYYVGGMPEAVKTFVATGDRTRVRKVQISIIQSYRDDIPKYTKGKQGKLVLDVFEYTAANLGQDKVIFSKISGKNSKLVREAIDLLSMAGVVHKVSHSNCSELPLSAGSDGSSIKLFFLDVGLYNATQQVGWSDLFYLSAEQLLTKGSMAEQFVAQHLKFLTPDGQRRDLYYWLREQKKGAAEVDFVLPLNSVIYPVEVKSGASGKMRSLWQYIAEKKTKHAIRVDLKLRKKLISDIDHQIKTKDGISRVKCKLLGVPVYATESLHSLVSEAVSESRG